MRENGWHENPMTIQDGTKDADSAIHFHRANVRNFSI
jgi:hypothetical protein